MSEEPNILKRLAEIREQQGLPPMPDPGVIGGGPAPWPKWEHENPDEEEEAIELPDSPLVPKFTAPVAVPAPAPASLDPNELVVVGRAATYHGHAVEISEAEKQKIGELVLRAALRKVAALLPRRKRRKVGMEAMDSGRRVAHSEEAGSIPAVPAKRRGRPPKQRLDGSTR